MNTDDRTIGRWIGPLLGAALLMGACGSDPAGPGAALLGESETLALDDQADQVDRAAAAPAVDDAAIESEDSMVDVGPTGFEMDRIEQVEGLPDDAFTAEAFEAMRSDDEARAVVLAEMEAQGLEADEAECFLDNLSSELYITFGSGEMPAEEQFAELMELLVLCDVSLVDGS